MYEPICAIRNFRDYSLESSKMAVFLLDSRHQVKIPFSGRDVKTSDSSRKLNFKQRIDFF